jgi:hypothetical protein
MNDSGVIAYATTSLCNLLPTVRLLLHCVSSGLMYSQLNARLLTAGSTVD